ncbi:MAG: hypothetical protein ACP6IY_10605 [Promethearchaeia archaeon]
MNLRLLQILLIFGFSSPFYFFLAFKIIKRNRDLPTKYLFLFYLTGGILMGINIFYSLIQVEKIVCLLHYLVDYLIMLSNIFLLLFYLIIYRPETVITRKKQFLIILFYHFLLIPAFLIPNGVIINESTNWKPVWSLSFTLYLLILSIFYIAIPIIIIFIKVSLNLEKSSLKRKWYMLSFGTFNFIIVAYVSFILNYLNNPSLRIIYFLFGIWLIPSCIFIFYGSKNSRNT